MLVSSILIVPGAWALAAVCRWFCRNLKFSDGRTATFTGRGGEIVGWWILAVLFGGIRFNIGGSHGYGIRIVNARVGIPVAIAAWLLGAFAGWQILRWCVRSVAFESGERFSFEGGFWSLLGWDLFVDLLVLTIIGWAWGLAAMYRWMTENTRSEKAELRFHGEGHQILWRVVVTMLLCILIVPIPWAILWYSRWLTANTTIEGSIAR
jgi:hypothetical protein